MFPGAQGGPLCHVIAGKAVCFAIARGEAFRAYQAQVRRNASALADTLIARGHRLVAGGTDNHLVLLNLRDTEWDGQTAEDRFAEVALTVNRNAVPFDPRPPAVASGIRIGTPAATMRGLDEADFAEVANVIADALEPDAAVKVLRGRIETVLERRPLYDGMAAYGRMR